MDELELRGLIEDLRSGACSPDDAVRRLRRLPFAELGFAKVDHHRALRQRLPEAVYGPGKTPAQCAAIVEELLVSAAEGPGASHPCRRGAGRGLARGVAQAGVRTPARSRKPVASAPSPGARSRPGPGASSSARPARPICPWPRSALAVLRAFGFRPALLGDCGVAGVHRLFASIDEITDADAIVVVAGMEGALASLVAGLTPAPVIAVPTSVGYGASLEGVTALLAMHASCAAGITVVGIDNGFGAACAVARMLRDRDARRPRSRR